MTIYFPTWCPGDPCDPCACVAKDTSSHVTSSSVSVINVDLGTMAICAQHFIWPFVKRATLDPSTGNRVGYYPIGLGAAGAASPPAPPGQRVYVDAIEKVNLSYLGNLLFSTTVTTHFIGDANISTITEEQISSNPAPMTQFKMLYADAVGIAHLYGSTIQQYFGDYTQDSTDPTYPNSPITLSGFVYTDPIDQTVDKTLSATWFDLSPYPQGVGFYGYTPPVYYCPQPVQSKPRRRVPLIGRFQNT